MRSTALVVSVLVVASMASACVPLNPGAGGLYLGEQADIEPVVTPVDDPIVWGHAPPIDDNYGGRIYDGASTDPRPALEGGLQPLRLWVADPDDGRTGRPAIIWIHGGGFAYGIDSMHRLADTTGRAYARRGYVSFSIEYRIDTTVVPSGGQRSPSLCQWVQDHADDGDPAWPARSEQCRRNVDTALHDALGAVRWVRAHADEFGIDPAKVAVAGFSAGAVTAANTAYRSDEIGTVSYFDGDTRAAADSTPRAVLGASGCSTGGEVGVPADVDAGDAPVSFIQSEFDAALPYACARATIDAARAAGLVAELTSYCGEAGHANNLYSTHVEATDEQWTTFLARELNLYLAMPDAPDDPYC